jgi:hypothetical protein
MSFLMFATSFASKNTSENTSENTSKRTLCQDRLRTEQMRCLNRLGGATH